MFTTPKLIYSPQNRPSTPHLRKYFDGKQSDLSHTQEFLWPWSSPGRGTKKEPPPNGDGSESCRINCAGTRARTPKQLRPGHPPGCTSGAQPTRRARRGNRSTRTNRHGSDPNPTRHRRRAAAGAGRRWADTGQSVCDRDHILTRHTGAGLHDQTWQITTNTQTQQTQHANTITTPPTRDEHGPTPPHRDDQAHPVPPCRRAIGT
jgi:hypothetical protein